MRLSLRFVIPLLLMLALVAYASIPLVESTTTKWFVRDLDVRAQLVASSLEPLLPVNPLSSKAKTLKIFDSVMQDGRLIAMAICGADSSTPSLTTAAWPAAVACPQLADGEVDASRVDELKSSHPEKNSTPFSSYRRLYHVSVHRLTQNGETQPLQLVLIHDMSFAQERSASFKRYVFYVFLSLGLLISIITIFVAELSVRGWQQTILSVLRGETFRRKHLWFKAAEIHPVTRELQMKLREIESERRLRDDTNITWTPKTLRSILNEELADQEIITVSNREPYIHQKNNDGKIEVKRPASGLVTALEPVMRACSGTWIAHGSGSGDHESVDKKDHVQVPPENPQYQIRRIWLTEEEEQGHYYGFSNEGLWPLCHIAHTRPIFRQEDWEMYKQVNQKFADAVVAEAKTSNPVVLVQDYHFALLPAMVRKQLPNATIITFWHIPWTNPEAFGICPWREELLEGMLGSSILGFHTSFHCRNFLDTVDRYLESRIDRDSSTVVYHKKPTSVQSYPISIAWPLQGAENLPSATECRMQIRNLHKLKHDAVLGVGVDRLDYTKGIIERCKAVERFLEKNPDWIGRLTFVQIAAPSRSKLTSYKDFAEELNLTCQKINERFGKADYQPIILLAEHHAPEDVFRYFRAADFALVTSLHDGMNLVAKEFIAAREDEKGVLILSQFTGAARELPESLIVNPYDMDQCADAILTAVTMPLKEQEARMKSMRLLVKEFNIYRWAGRMLLDAARMRQRLRVTSKSRLYRDAVQQAEVI